jgi:chromatin structure-remodeling complex subunit RSC3/30
MGMTSHFALFKESTEYLGVSALHRSQDIFDNTPSLNLDVIPAESGDVREGAFLLHLLRDLPIYQRVAEAWLKITQDTEFLGRPLVEATFKSLQEFKTRDPSTLRTRSLEIFRLFSVSVPIHNSLSFMDFMASMACRWEIIGLAFSFVALGTVFPCDWDLMFQVEGIPVIPRKDLGLLALSAVELCLRFCNEAGVLNDALSWLTCQHTFLVTLIHGDRGKPLEPRQENQLLIHLV